MKELFKPSFWQNVRKTFDEAREDAQPQKIEAPSKPDQPAEPPTPDGSDSPLTGS
jgi:hypothetical protein